MSAEMWAGVINSDQAQVHDLYSISSEGRTVLTNVSEVDIWWTSVTAATEWIPSDGVLQIEDTWDGLSNILSSQSGHSAFAFATQSDLGSDSAGHPQLLTIVQMWYYPSGHVNYDGSGGRPAQLHIHYSVNPSGGWEFESMALTASLDSMVDEVISHQAGGYVVPVHYGSKQDSQGMPMDEPRAFLYQPSQTAMRWSSNLRVARGSTTTTSANLGESSEILQEILMMRVQSVSGEIDSFAGVFDGGVLQQTINATHGVTAVGSPFEPVAGGDDDHRMVGGGLLLVVLVGCGLVCCRCGLRKLCCQRSQSDGLDRNSSKLRSLSGNAFGRQWEQVKPEDDDEPRDSISGGDSGDAASEENPILTPGQEDESSHDDGSLLRIPSKGPFPVEIDPEQTVCDWMLRRGYNATQGREVCAAMAAAHVAPAEWVMELEGMASDGQLAAFIETLPSTTKGTPKSRSVLSAHV